METKRQRRTYYSASFKKQVAEYSRISGNRAAARKCNIDESCVRRWKKNIKIIRLCKPSQKSVTGPKVGRFKEIEDCLFNWIIEQRNNGMPVSQNAIRIKAIRIARTQNVPREQFKASMGWCKKFMQRFGLSLRRRTTIAQKLPSDYTDKLIEYQKYVINLRKEHKYVFGAIGNADETPVFFDMPSNTTVNIKGAKTISLRTTGAEKQRVTVMLCVLADGTKLPPFVILKRKLLPKENLPAGLFVRTQEKGWMTANLMIDWIRSVWNRRPGALSQQRSLLILDAFKGHLHDSVKKVLRFGHTDLVIIPGGMTSILQILDVVVNKPFKDHLRESYSNWLMNNSHELTKSGRIKKPSIRDICDWILESWEKISCESIMKGFKKCCVTNALDGSEDDILWDDETQKNVIGNNETFEVIYTEDENQVENDIGSLDESNNEYGINVNEEILHSESSHDHISKDSSSETESSEGSDIPINEIDTNCTQEILYLEVTDGSPGENSSENSGSVSDTET